MKKLSSSMVIFLSLFLLISLPVEAKSNLSAVKNSSGWYEMSEQDKEDTIIALVDVISKDLGIASTPRLYFYNSDEWPVAAEYYDCINYIYVNMSTFATSADADAAGESIGYHIAKILAHEVRHDFQFEHREDDSDYGRAVKANSAAGYTQYYDNVDGYMLQFNETDANAYGVDFANRYVKK